MERSQVAREGSGQRTSVLSSCLPMSLFYTRGDLGLDKLVTGGAGASAWAACMQGN